MLVQDVMQRGVVVLEWNGLAWSQGGALMIIPGDSRS